MEYEIQISINKAIDNIVEIAKSSLLEDIEIDIDYREIEEKTCSNELVLGGEA